MKYNYTTDYSHPHYYSGKVFTSNRYGRYRILGKLLNHNRRGYYVVQFEETGHTTKAYCSAIKSGKVADRSYDFGNEDERREALMRPVIHGVGYIGIGPYRTYVPYTPETYGQRTKEYVLWQNMIARCYYTRNGKQVHKGYKCVVVCERWHCFQNFCSDLPAIPGYGNWKNNPVKYEFDKDYSHRRYYSPDTMCFIPTSDNAKEAGLRNQAMKISKSDYYSINKNRKVIVDDALAILEDSEIQFSMVMNGNTHTIITDTPYGTTIFFPLTKKIMRHCSIIDGDVHVFIQYVQWLQRQWRERNPFIDCYEVM